MADKELKKIEDALELFLEQQGKGAVDTFKAQVKAARKTASGTLYNSFRAKVEGKGTIKTLKISADRSFYNVASGRKPEKAGYGKRFVPIKPLQKWMRDRGLPDSRKIAFAISKKINERGIKRVYQLNKMRKNYDNIIYEKLPEMFNSAMNEVTNDIIKDSAAQQGLSIEIK